MAQTNQIGVRMNWFAFASLLATFLSGPAVGIAWSQNDSGLIEPGAGTWQTWVLQSGSDLRTPAPPEMSQTMGELDSVRAIASQRDSGAMDRIRYWDTGAPGYRWNEIGTIQTSTFRASRGLRAMALLNVAIYDATIAAWDSKYAYNRPRPNELDPSLPTAIPTPRSPSYPSEHAVVAAAAAGVLSYLFPASAQSFSDMANAAAQSRIDAGVQYQSDVDAGLALGRQVASKVIAWAQADGSDAVWTGSVPQGPGKWNGTNPVEPLAGTWRTWALTSGNQFRPGPPPAYDSDQEKKELDEVKNFPRDVNAQTTNATAWSWQPQAVIILAPLVNQKIFEYHLDSNPPRAARIETLLYIAAYDASTAVWDGKYAYWAIRPNQLDGSVTTLFPTPPHPSYPSAHSTIIAAAMATLAYLFPREVDYFNGKADECAMTRIWAGIHFRSDIETGEALGRTVAGVVIAHAQNDGSQ